MKNKIYRVTHSFKNETRQGKLKMTLTKTPEERYFSMLDLCDFLIKANPEIIQRHDAYTESTRNSVQILIRLDVQTKTPGIDFKKAWKRKAVFKVSGINVYSLNIDDLISSKNAAGRKEDKEDIKYLKLIKTKA